ncbi:hypothetical protein [Neolewinella antarctica]|uniref:BRCT domain-containing protein n=1 Tax=Neolewinella antarctica TaxID=442734 RepID=A0ABX0XHN6_9BACT|nr:hypothetical protein [Neolewinella antarctica]NJC28399.1 hypothetical protein [Neolewinella antarctica]
MTGCDLSNPDGAALLRELENLGGNVRQTEEDRPQAAVTIVTEQKFLDELG